MKNYLLLPLLIIFSYTLPAQQTVFEKSGGEKTASYFEAIAWYNQLHKIYPSVTVKQMGNTDAGYPLELVLLSSDHQFDPIRWHKERKVVILINNGIHPGEPDGIDACMMLTRDIAAGKIKLPKNIVLAIIPVYNIGGALNRNSTSRVNQNGPEAYGFRGNAQNLDLNRDFTKCDSREARSFAGIFHSLDPDIFIDSHVSDGADYQHTMTLISTQYDKLGPGLGAWLRDSFEPVIYKNMASKGWDLIPYVDFGSTDFSKGMNMFYESPRYSTGYAALFNSVSFMPETHMLKPYKQRVRSTYDLMATFITEASAHAEELIVNRNKDKQAVLSQTTFPLSWTVDTSRYSEITFKGYEADSTLSLATGMQKMYYNHQKPYTRKIKYFNFFKPVNTVEKPAAYIIPKGWYEVAALLKLNGVVLHSFKQDTSIEVTVYHIDDYKSFTQPYEKHHKNYAVKVSSKKESVKFLKGDFIVEMNQQCNRYIIEMLEPTGDDSFFSWNFFDAVLQQKEGYSDYRWDSIAGDLLKKDPQLREKLQAKKSEDPKFSRDPAAILNFIYKNSPYYEKEHLRYPVYRVEMIK